MQPFDSYFNNWAVNITNRNKNFAPIPPIINVTAQLGGDLDITLTLFSIHGDMY